MVPQCETIIFSLLLACRPKFDSYDSIPWVLKGKANPPTSHSTALSITSSFSSSSAVSITLTSQLISSSAISTTLKIFSSSSTSTSVAASPSPSILTSQPTSPPSPMSAVPFASSSSSLTSQIKSSSSAPSITRPTSSSTLLTSQPASTTPGLSTPVTEPTEPTEPSSGEDTSTNTKPTTNFVEENVETFKGSLTLKDRTYTNELENPDSSAFKELAKEITQVLWEILKNDKFPVKVEVLSFKEGSIICTFRITVRKESVTAEKLKEALTNASKDANKTGPFTFEEIAVEREEKEGSTQGYPGAKGDKWPMWMIVLTTVCGVLFLLILVMAYLLCKRTRSHRINQMYAINIFDKDLQVAQDEDGMGQSRV